MSRLVGGVEANFLRIVLATAFLAVYAHTRGSGLHGPALPYFLVSGVIGFGMGDLALYQALPRIGSRLSMILVHCLAAPIAAAAEWIWLGTALNTLQIFFSVVILVGVAVALAPRDHLHIPRPVLVAGVCFGLVAALGQAFGAVTSRKAYAVAGLAHQNIDGITAAYQRIWGGVFFASAGYAIYRWRSKDRGPTGAFIGRLRTAWKWLLLNAAAGPAIGVSFFQLALSSAPTGIVLPIVALTPVTIIPFAQRFENEKPSARSLIGGLIAVSGVIGLRLSLQ